MKHALVIGGGSKKSQVIIDCLVDNDFQVINIGSSEHPRANNIRIEWSQLDIPTVHKLCKFQQQFDFVFFNQNSSSLNHTDYDPDLSTLKTWRLIKDWTHSQWISCQLPFLIVHSLKNNLSNKSKIGWMLSSYIDYQSLDIEKFPDYSANKYQNYLQMIAFGQHYQTFGILPDFNRQDSMEILKTITKSIIDKENLDKTLYRF